MAVMNHSLRDSGLQDSVGMWLKRLVLLVACVFLAFCCWFVWRISMVAMQAEAAIVAISADVKQMSTTGAQISQHLQQLDVRLRSMEEKAADAIKLDDIEHMLDEAAQLRDGGVASGSISPDTEREIKHLLSQVRRSKYRFKYSDEDKGGMRFYLQLYTKYETYKKLLASAEDFIDKVATTSIAGHAYQVVIDDKQTVALNEWLTDELKKYRAGAQSANTGDR
jgi:hypothetical protein